MGLKNIYIRWRKLSKGHGQRRKGRRPIQSQSQVNSSMRFQGRSNKAIRWLAERWIKEMRRGQRTMRACRGLTSDSQRKRWTEELYLALFPHPPQSNHLNYLGRKGSCDTISKSRQSIYIKQKNEETCSFESKRAWFGETFLDWEKEHDVSGPFLASPLRFSGQSESSKFEIGQFKFFSQGKIHFSSLNNISLHPRQYKYQVLIEGQGLIQKFQIKLEKRLVIQIALAILCWLQVLPSAWMHLVARMCFTHHSATSKNHHIIIILPSHTFTPSLRIPAESSIG